MSFSENLSEFFTDFAVPATVDAVSVVGIYDDGYAEWDDIEGTFPAFTCKEADLPAGVADGSAITVSGKTYVVRSLRPDGTGVVVLRLEYVSG